MLRLTRARLAASMIPVALAALVAAGCGLGGLVFDLRGGAGGAGSSATTGSSPGCGNGVLDPGEGCDDGNAIPGDGCSPTCQVETSAACPGVAVSLAPPGLAIKGTLTALSAEVAPSCGAGLADAVYAVTPTVAGTLVVTVPAVTPVHVISIRAACPGGPMGELACGNPAEGQTRIWAYAGVTYDVVVAGDLSPFTLNLDLTRCGDGVVQGLEECDDPTDATCVGCFRCKGVGEFLAPLSKHCYLRGASSSPWAKARVQCANWGGDLAGFGAQRELDFLAGAKMAGSGAWTSGNDLAKHCEFSWANGEPWTARWADGEPAIGGPEGCVAVRDNSGAVEMNDLPCDKSMPYLCERAPGGSCGDGIVQPGEQCEAAESPTCKACVLGCKPGELQDPATRHCYSLSSAMATWPDASAACQSQDATLAAIGSAEEEALIEKLLQPDAWIGGTLTLGFVWSDGESLACYADWAAGAPSGANGCVLASAMSGWQDADCMSPHSYLCERDH